MTPSSGAPLRRSTLAAYAAPSLPISALGLPLLVYLPEFYVSEVGMSLALVGLAFMLVRLCDIGFDPLVGALMDRTQARFGRFRLWLLMGAPLLIAGVFILFTARHGASPARLIGGLVITYAGYSICALSHMAWGAGLASGFHERSRIYSWWQGGNIIGNILVLVAPALAFQFLKLDHAAGVRAMGLFICVLAPLAFLTAAVLVPERREPRPDGSSARFGDYWRLLGNANLRRLLICDLLVGMAPGFAGSLFLLFFQLARDFSKLESSLLLLAYFVGGLVGAPIWVRLSQRIGKARALAASLLMYAACQAWWLVMPHGAFGAGLAALFVAGLPFAAGAALLRSMVADVSDEIRLETGADRTGLLFALLTGASKASHALSVGIAFSLLQIANFKPAAPTPDSVQALSALYIVPPALFALAGAALIFRFSLNETEHARILAALAMKDPGSRSAL